MMQIFSINRSTKPDIYEGDITYCCEVMHLSILTDQHHESCDSSITPK